MNVLNKKDQTVTTQSDKAYEFLREAILNNQIKAGFPVLEVEIASQIGMSRTPVRDAINRLKMEGLLEAIPRKGVFVKSVSKQEIRFIYEMAEGLEGMIAYLAAENSENSCLEQLSGCISQMEESLISGRIDSWLLADENYHKALYALCDNQYLVEEISRVNTQIHLMRFTKPTHRDLSFAEHKKTFEAISAGDKFAAREITQKHWERVRSEILQMLL